MKRKDIRRPGSHDAEARDTLRPLGEALYALNLRTPWTLLTKTHQALDRLNVAFEDRLDSAVWPVANPAANSFGIRSPTRAVAEEDSLHASVDHHAFPNGAAL